MWLRGDQIEVFKILNGSENIYRNILFSLKEDRTRGHVDQKVLVLTETWDNKLMEQIIFAHCTDCVNASSVNMFKNKIDKYLRRGVTCRGNIFGLSISQLLPCPLTIWAFALDGNLIKSCYA